MREAQIFILLVKLGVMASSASILVRSDAFKRILTRENRTLKQQLTLALALSVVFGAGVATRVITQRYEAVDLSLEAALLSGMIGGYVTGLVVGGLVAIPAMLGGEFLSLPLLTAVGALGGLLRDAARDPEDIWRFSPSFDLNIYRLFRRKYDRRLTLYHLAVFLTILFAEFLRLSLGHLFGGELVFYLYPSAPNPWLVAAVYATTLFATVLPLKIWNNTRIERKLDEQQRVLMQARLDALTSQINPHFLFNTLNSVSSLIRTDPHKARTMVLNLSRILRRLMRKHENFTPLREELKFIEDYLAIEMVRFGDKLRVQTSIDPETVDRLVPSMLLQPLIENSVKHGLGSKVDGGTLKLSSRFSNGRLHLVVEDDGVGIPEAKLAHLFEKGIGVSNVNERLKVLFGAEYRMWIDSKPDEGTRIEIEIPDVQGGPPLLAGGELQKVSSF